MEWTPNKSQHTKLTLKKKILPLLLPGFELATFRSRVRGSNQQAIRAPQKALYTRYCGVTHEISRQLTTQSHLCAIPLTKQMVLHEHLPHHEGLGSTVNGHPYMVNMYSAYHCLPLKITMFKSSLSWMYWMVVYNACSALRDWVA